MEVDGDGSASRVEKPVKEGGGVAVSSFAEACSVLSNLDATDFVEEKMNLIYRLRCDDDSTGNYLSGYFMTLALGRERGVHISRRCINSGDDEKQYYYPHNSNKQTYTLLSDTIQGYLPKVRVFKKRKKKKKSRDVCSLCSSGYVHTCAEGPNHAVPYFGKILRKMAKTWHEGQKEQLVKYFGNEMTNYVNEDELVLDDVAIHIRCGDILKYAHHDNYGFAPYKIYEDVLMPFYEEKSEKSRKMKSIGIITATKEKCRINKDCDFVDKCETINQNLKTYLVKTFPGTKVTIRNSENETVVSAWSRLILAPVASFCNPSTFCVWPTVTAAYSNKDDRYARSTNERTLAIVVRSDKLYPWVDNVNLANLKYLDVNFLSPSEIIRRGLNLTEQIEDELAIRPAFKR